MIPITIPTNNYKNILFAIKAAVRWFEGESELGGVQRWQIEANTGGKAAYKKLKKALVILENERLSTFIDDLNKEKGK